MLDLLSYPRSYLVSVFTGIFTIFQSAMVIAISLAGVPRAKGHKYIAYTWARVVFWLAGVKVVVRGQENLPLKDGFLALFNHTSHMDIITLYGYMPRPVCFGAKVELFKVPFFGKAMRTMGAIPINRAQREKVLELYRAAIPRMEAGEAFALAPEGTRQPEPVLGKFKYGPFLFAVQAQKQIVPVVIAGAYDVLPKKSLWINQGRWRRLIIMEILKAETTTGLKDTDLERLQESVHERMRLALERLIPETLAYRT